MSEVAGLGRIPAGPRLFAALAELGPVARRMVDENGRPEILPDCGDQVIVAQQWQRAIAWADSQLNAAIVQIAGSWVSPDEEDWGREEVAAGLRLSGLTAGSRIDVARVLAGRGFLTRRALEEGRITQRHAEEIVRALEPLDDDTAALVEAKLLGLADTKTPAQLAARARKEVAKADPAGADARHRKARTGRRVDFTAAPDGMARLDALLPADHAARARATIDDLSGKMRHGNDDRTLDQRRADALIALLDIGGLTTTGLLPTPPVLSGIPGLGSPASPTDPTHTAAATTDPTATDPATTGLTGTATPTGTSTGSTSSDPASLDRASAGSASTAGIAPASAGSAGTGSATPISAACTESTPDNNAPTGPAGPAPTGPALAGTAPTGTGPTGAGPAGCGCDACPHHERGATAGGQLDKKTLQLIRTVLAGKRATPARIALTAPLSTVLATSNTPGDLTGYGPVPATIVRELAGDGHWEKWITDTGGVITDLGRSTYRPTARLAALIRATYPTCMFPGCSMPSYRCDLDHNIRHIDGGHTSTQNLLPLCRRHHRAKDEAGWEVAHDAATGTCTWTSPAGHTYTVTPPDQSDDTEALTVPADWTAPLAPEPVPAGAPAAEDPPPF
ncbi:DUF222 domain-containing protein [Cryptosporangium sp. NPDC048952]|uniref:HNH endonuclease signature motif containing protein n=1 Tax=Cryptosporangium sp. NPDC048952 TaxID=3363961 RepID=UPI0037245308